MNRVIIAAFLLLWVYMAVLAVKLIAVDGYTFNISFNIFDLLTAFCFLVLAMLPMLLSEWASTRYKGQWTNFGRFDVFIIENPKAFWKDVTRLLRRFGISSMRPYRRRRKVERNQRRENIENMIALQAAQTTNDDSKKI